MAGISSLLVISIVIDCDRGNCYENLKKKTNYDGNWARDLYFNVCVYHEFWAARNGKKVMFWTFPAKPASGLFHPYFVCKSSFSVISIIKMVILDQSKPISLYLKIQNWKIYKLLVYYS